MGAPRHGSRPGTSSLRTLGTRVEQPDATSNQLIAGSSMLSVGSCTISLAPIRSQRARTAKEQSSCVRREMTSTSVRSSRDVTSAFSSSRTDWISLAVAGASELSARRWSDACGPSDMRTKPLTEAEEPR